MMKLIQLCSSNLWGSYGCASNGTRVLMYLTRTLTSSVSISKDTTLYCRLSPIRDPNVSVVPILDQWVKEGRSINREDLHKIIKQFRTFNRFEHALQISQWTSDKKFIDLKTKDVAVQLDLISKVHGLKQAEEYFDNIPNTLRVWQIYGALLNCYADAKLLEKAEATLQKMRELGYAKPLSYNIMLGLYSQMGKHEKLDPLMQEMAKKGIICDKFTYNIRLNAYADSSNIEKMEKLIMKMEADPVVTMEWNTYAIAAKGYLKAGATEKALVSLKKSEHLIRVKNRKSAYEVILTLYASTGRKDEVFRIWNLHKELGKCFNMGYLCMISSLAKLDDLDGAEKIFEEWEARKTRFDHRVPNFLITAYCQKGLLEKAESVVNRLIESGNEPSASTWSSMALGYISDNQMDKVVETMKKAILASCPGWKPDLDTLASCLEYLKGKGDINTAEEIKISLQEKGLLSAYMYNGLVEYYEKGKAGSKASFEMVGDGQTLEVEMNGSIESNYENSRLNNGAIDCQDFTSNLL